MKDFLPKFSIYIPAMLEIPRTLSFHVRALKFEHRFEPYKLMYWLRHTLTNAQRVILEEQHVLQFSLQESCPHNIFHIRSVQFPLQWHGASLYHLSWAVSVSFDLPASLVNLSFHCFIRPMFHICFRSRPTFLLCAPSPESVSPLLYHGSLLQLHDSKHLPLPVQSASISHICLLCFLHTSLGPSTFSLPAPSSEVRENTSNTVSLFLILVPGSVLSTACSIPQLPSEGLSQTVLGWAICRNNV